MKNSDAVEVAVEPGAAMLKGAGSCVRGLSAVRISITGSGSVLLSGVSEAGRPLKGGIILPPEAMTRLAEDWLAHQQATKRRASKDPKNLPKSDNGEMRKYSEEFEKLWQRTLDEKVEASGVVKSRRDLYTEQCLEDWKEVLYRSWEQWAM